MIQTVNSVAVVGIRTRALRIVEVIATMIIARISVGGLYPEISPELDFDCYTDSLARSLLGGVLIPRL